jgi:hypothetical protein
MPPFQDNLPLYLGLAAGVTIALVAVFFLVRRAMAPAEEAGPATEDVTIDVEKLSGGGPPTAGPQLEFYHVPVRLAVLILAPVGRSGVVPPTNSLPEAMNQFLPGFMEVLSAHQPLFRRWPRQLSYHGFAGMFFGNVRLPGDRGKGTVWSGVVGKFTYNGQQLLAGMILQADRPVALGQVTLENEHQWLDVLRVKL